VRGLGVTTAKRSELAPELPTIAESGAPGFDVMGWFAFFVPARTPRAIVEKIHIDSVTAPKRSDRQVKTREHRHGGCRFDARRTCRAARGRVGKMETCDQGG